MELPQPYEAVDELGPGLYASRRPGEKGMVVVRIAAAGKAKTGIHPGQLSEPEELIGRAAAQARARDSRFWVPVLDSGESAEMAYCVYPAYPDSLSRYLAFTSLSDIAVWTVMDRLTSGLEHYRDVASRPHGNIKPSNILLETTRGRWWQHVRLSDPLADAECPDDSPWRADMAALGDILFRMVLQHAAEPMEIPSTDTPWIEALGPVGARWRDLCANLLDRTHPMTLDDVRAALRDLRPRTSPKRRVLRVLALVVPLLILPLGMLWWPPNPSRIPRPFRDQIIRFRCAVGMQCYDPEAWEQLCEQYDAWLGNFVAEAQAEDRPRRWKEDQYLDRLMGLLEQASLDTLDPRGIAEAQAAYRHLATDHPEGAKTCGAYDLTLASLANVRTIQRVLEQADEKQGGWPTMRYLSETLAARCEEAGWQPTAEHLRTLPEQMAPRHDAADVVENVLRWWETVGALASDLDQRIATVANQGTDGLKGLPAAVTAELRKGNARSRGALDDMDDLHGYIEEASKVTSRIETFVADEWSAWPTAERNDWTHEEKTILAEADDSGLDRYRQWLSEARQFTADDSADWLITAKKDDSITTSDVLNQAWRTRRDALVSDISRGDLRRDPDRNATLRSRVEDLRYLLSSLDDQSILPAVPPQGIGQAIMAKREETLGRILSLYTNQPVEELKRSSDVQRVSAEYRQWRRQLPELARQLNEARRLLRLLYRYDERTADGDATVRDLHQRWMGADVWTAAELPAPLKTTRRWMKALAAVPDATDVHALRQTAADSATALPIRLAAWRRLGQLDWPADENQRAVDGTVREQLQQDIQTWEDDLGERRDAILWELRTEGYRRDLHPLLTVLRGQDHSVLASFVETCDDAIQSAASAPGDTDAMDRLDLLTDAADGIREVVLAAGWPGAYHQELLQRELPVPESAQISFYRTWPERTDAYRLLTPDPRGDPAQWRSRIEQLGRDLDSLAPFPGERQAAADSLERLEQQTEALLQLAPIRRHAEGIGSQRRALEEGMARHRNDFGLLDPNPILPREAWDRLLERLLADIVELADGSADLRKTHAELKDRVDRLLAIAPLQRHRKTIEELLQSIDQTVEALEDEVDPGLWLDNARAMKPVSADDVANRIWAERKEELLAGLTAESLEANRATYRLLRDRVRSLNARFADIDWDHALPPGMVRSPADLPDAEWHAELPAEIARRREEAIRKVTADELSDAERDALFSTYRATRDALGRCRNELTQADRRLAFWALPEEPLTESGGPQIVRSLAEWQENAYVRAALPRCPRMQTFCGDLFQLNRELVAIAREKDLDTVAGSMPAMLDRDKEADARPGDTGPSSAAAAANLLKLHASYMRLGDIGWPSTLDHMRADVRYSTWLLARLPRARQTSLRERLENEQLTRWARGFEQLEDCRHILRDSIALLRTAFNLTATDAKARFQQLALHARVNLVIASLLEAVDATASTADALRVRDGAVAELDELSRQVRHPDPRFVYIQNRMNALRGVEGAAVSGGLRGLADSGPGRVGWQASINPRRTVVSYSRTLGGTAYVLTFVRVTPENGEDSRPAFICTVEMPVGLFVDVCAQSDDRRPHGRWPEMLSFYTEKMRTAQADPRLGPRTWHLSGSDSAVVFKAAPRLWLTETGEFTETAHYPDGVRPESPAHNHPVQYVPPRAAAFFCFGLGCRLPTSAEWQAAFRRAAADTNAPNLRDRQWYRQYQHMMLFKPERRGWGILQTAAEKHWPHADAFPFLEAIAGSRQSLEQDSDFHRTDDGYLWFRPVPSGATAPVPGPVDMVGNVAEFIYEDAGEFDRLLARGRTSADAVRTDIADPHKFGVIGNSALAPPVIAEEGTTPYRIPSGTKGWVQGFSDVGIRLAFTAPDENIPGKLLALAEGLCMSPAD